MKLNGGITAAAGALLCSVTDPMLVLPAHNRSAHAAYRVVCSPLCLNGTGFFSKSPCSGRKICMGTDWKQLVKALKRMLICRIFLWSELENLIGKVMLLVEFCTFFFGIVLFWF